MKKIKIFAMLLFLFSAQTAFSGEISDEIPENYKFRFFNREDAPNKELTDFDPNFNPNDANACNHNCSQDNEVQGITSFYEKYWVLSKNKWFYVYAVDENDELFSRSHQVDDFESDGGKMKDIEFFDNHLYVPRGKKIDIFE